MRTGDDDDGDEDGDDDDAKSMTIRHQCSAQENGCNTQRSDLLVPFVDLTLRELHHHRGHRHIKLDLARVLPSIIIKGKITVTAPT